MKARTDEASSEPKGGRARFWSRFTGVLHANGAAPAATIVVVLIIVVLSLFSTMRGFLEDVATVETLRVAGEAVDTEAVDAQTGARDPGLVGGDPVRVDFWTVLYAILQLFTLNAPPLEVAPVPLLIRLARVFAPAVGAITVILSLNRVVRSIVRSNIVRLWSGHEVRCLSAAAASDYARARVSRPRTKRALLRDVLSALTRQPLDRSGHSLVVLPAVDEEVRRQLYRSRLAPVLAPFPDARSGPLANAVSGAARVFVDLGEDVQTLDYAFAAAGVDRSGSISPAAASGRKRSCLPPESVVAIVDEPALTEIEHGIANLSIQSRKERLGRGAVIAQPPRALGVGPLHLAVVGGGPDLVELLRSLTSVVDPGEPPWIHLILPDGTPKPDLSGLELVPKVDWCPPANIAGALRSIHDELSARVEQLGTGPSLGSPLIVHTRPDLTPLLAAQLTAIDELPRPVLIVAPTAESGGRTVDQRAGAADRRSQSSIRVIDVQEVSTMALLDGMPRLASSILDALKDSIGRWTNPELRGPHPASFLLARSPGEPPDPAALTRDHVEFLLRVFGGCGLSPRVVAEASAPKVQWLGDVVDHLMEAAPLHMRERSTTMGRQDDLLRWRVAAVDLVNLVPDILARLGVKLSSRTERLVLTSAQLEGMARHIHERYLQRFAQPGDGRASQKPWEELDEVFKSSNIAQARRVFPKLAILGRTPIAIPSTRDDPSSAGGWPGGSRPEGEILEIVKEVEHRGWCHYQLERGFRYATERDDVNRKHDLLVPYADLKEKDKDKDEDIVLFLPELLATVGLQVAP